MRPSSGPLKPVMLDLRKLQVFLAVIEEKSFSRAAERCYLSQPTVSGHIKALEDAFGVLLFDRHTREVRPTRAGELLYSYTKKILKLAEELEKEMDLFRAGGRGPLFIGGSTIPGQYILPPLLGAFKRLHPHTRITLKVSDSGEVTRMVAEGELDLGVVGARFSDQKLLFEPLWEDKIVLIVPPGLFEEEFPLEKLFHLPLIVREEGSGTWFTVKRVLEERGLSLEKLNIVAELGSTEAVKQAVKAGLGGAFVSEMAVREELAQGLVQKLVLPWSIKRHFYLVFPQGRTLSPIAQIFVDFCRVSD